MAGKKSVVTFQLANQYISRVRREKGYEEFTCKIINTEPEGVEIIDISMEIELEFELNPYKDRGEGRVILFNENEVNSFLHDIGITS